MVDNRIVTLFCAPGGQIIQAPSSLFTFYKRNSSFNGRLSQQQITKQQEDENQLNLTSVLSAIVVKPPTQTNFQADFPYVKKLLRNSSADSEVGSRAANLEKKKERVSKII